MATHEVHGMTVERLAAQVIELRAASYHKHAYLFSSCDIQFLLDVIKEKDAELVKANERGDYWLGKYSEHNEDACDESP